MKIAVISHKECWYDPTCKSRYVTIGGFPFQMKAIADLFDETVLCLPTFKTPAPPGAIPLSGHNLSVCPLDMPAGSDLKRKIHLIPWIFTNINSIWHVIKRADAVHCPVPGDIGTIGIIVSLICRKPLFVRHCGTWGDRETLAKRFLHLLLPRIAGEKNVVMATGGAESPPSNNPLMSWIFASTLTESELHSIAKRKLWKNGQPLQLVTASRLEPDKNIKAIIKALPSVISYYPDTTLHIIGNGSCLDDLKKLTYNLNLSGFVIFHGQLDHKGVMKILQETDIFVFPTLREGFPKVIVEAFACGLPVISTSVSVIPQLIGNDKGIILNENTPEALAKAIAHIISDEHRFAEISLKAQEASYYYTLERWQKMIGLRLKDAWGPLSSNYKVC